MTEYEKVQESIKDLMRVYSSKQKDYSAKNERELLAFIAAALKLQASLQALMVETNAKLLQELQTLRETLEINNECISELKQFM